MIASGKPVPQRAVLFSAHPWEATPYGLHHIAKALAALGWRVLFIEPRFSPFHLAGGRRRNRRLGRNFRSSEVAGVEILSPFVPVPHVNLPLLRGRSTLTLARLLSWPSLPGRLRSSVYQNAELVIVGDAASTPIALQLAAKLVAYRLADDNQLFASVTAPLRQLESTSLPACDVVLVTSNGLEEQARSSGARSVYLLSNGVDRSFFAVQVPTPAELASMPEPRVLYAGALEAWFDWDTVIDAALARPGYSFVLVGHVSTPAPRPLPGNVYLVGRRPYAEMPAFMRSASVGIIPFAMHQRRKAVEAINPLKLYEYLAAGLPVVTSIKPPALKSRWVRRYHSSEEFATELDYAIELHRRDAIEAPAAADWLSIVHRFLTEFGLAES